MTEQVSNSGHPASISTAKRYSTISQSGVVEKLEDGRALVRIYQNSACGSCAMQGGCSNKSPVATSGRIIDALAGEGVTMGSTVKIQMRSADGVLSVVLSFVLPLLLIFTTIFTLQRLGISEEILALTALATVAVYFIALSLFRGRLRQRISFLASPLNDSIDACELKPDS